MANIDLNLALEDSLHQAFINGGVERAVASLLEKEKEPVDILGFSIGGFIAWKAAWKGLRVRSLTAVSSNKIKV